MARASLTPREIDDFRRSAVDVATKLFAERGYQDVSMRAIAGDLGISSMTPYRYFKNKDALFALVRTEAFRRFADRQQKAAQTPPPRRVAALGRAYVQFAIDEPAAYRIMFELRQAPTARYPDLEAEQRRAFSYLVAAVAEAIKAGAMSGDPLTVAHLLWAQVHGLVSLHLAGKLIMGRSFEELSKTPAVSGQRGWS